MAVSPCASAKLYRNPWRAVILAAVVLVLAQTGFAQTAPRPAKSKGPRAIGLLAPLPNGKYRLIPIAILIDGQFFDASAYKASPVPMALEPGTVYEGQLTGVSQGLFTITQALQAPGMWAADGKWQTADALAAIAAKKHAVEATPRGLEDESGPPVLLRRSPKSPVTPPQPTPPAAPSTPAAPPTAPAPASPPATTAPTAAPAASTPPAPAPAPVAAATPPAPPAEVDPNEPVLRRGKPRPKPKESTATATKAPAKSTSAAAAAPTKSPAAVKTTPSPLQLVPAISDAAGPEPHPYAYNLKPEEEEKLRKRMLAMAADEIRARAQKQSPKTAAKPAPSKTPAHPARAAKLVQPEFEDVQFQAFDLALSNEPILVLSATAHMPRRTRASDSGPDLQYYITLVTRSDIYGDLHKALVQLTDTQHLDVLARYELIDAVDADGDGRGELLFRQVSDAGSAFAIYRVIGNQLWPLFEGTPGPDASAMRN